MKKRGVSLVEILIAAAILFAAMVPLWGLMGSSHQQVMRSADEVKASQLAVEIMEQLENSHCPECLPEDDAMQEYSLSSGGVVTIGNEPSVTIKISTFEEYFMPKLYVTASTLADSFTGTRAIGRIVALTIQYRSKEGRDQEYVLRGFVSANR